MHLARDVIGELFNPGVEEFNGQYDEEHADHSGVPGGVRRQNESQRHGDDEKHGLIAERRFGFETVDEPMQRIFGRAEKPHQGRIRF